MKQAILYILCRFLYKPYTYSSDNNCSTLSIKFSDVALIKGTTFNLYKILYNEKNYYFREIKKHVCFSDFLKEILNDYFLFGNLSKKFYSQRDFIYSIFMRRNTLINIYNMGIVNDCNSRIYKFFKTHDFSIFDIEELSFLNLCDVLDLFQYLWGEVYLYRLNGGVKKNYYQTFNSSKSLATKKLADIIGIGNLIPNIRTIKLIIGNNIVKYGTLMDEAEGISPTKISIGDRKKFSPNFYRSCCSLNLLDALTNEKDHRPGNYFVNYKKGLIDTIVAFDNDAPLTFFLTPSINLVSYFNSSPFLTRNGLIKMNHIDCDIANSILNLTKKDVYSNFSNILSKKQICFLYIRIKHMKRAIMRTMKVKSNFLLKKSDWNYTMANEEISSGDNTYLWIFLYDNHNENDYSVSKYL